MGHVRLMNLIVRNKKNEAWLKVTSSLYEKFLNNTKIETKILVSKYKSYSYHHITKFVL